MFSPVFDRLITNLLTFQPFSTQNHQTKINPKPSDDFFGGRPARAQIVRLLDRRLHQPVLRSSDSALARRIFSLSVDQKIQAQRPNYFESCEEAGSGNSATPVLHDFVSQKNQQQTMCRKIFNYHQMTLILRDLILLD
jgi:hypothetical protein